MALKIIWTQTASEDLREIVQYIALDDPEAPVNLADSRVGAILSLDLR